MKKDDQNPSFEVWLAAYNQRLIEVAGLTAPTANTGKSSSPQNIRREESPPLGTEKPTQKD